MPFQCTQAGLLLLLTYSIGSCLEQVLPGLETFFLDALQLRQLCPNDGLAALAALAQAPPADAAQLRVRAGALYAEVEAHPYPNPDPDPDPDPSQVRCTRRSRPC